MTCAECQELLDAFIDGEVTGEESAQVRAHVASCADCAERLASRTKLSRGVKDLPRYSAPDTLRARIHSSIIAAPDVALRAPTPRSNWRRIATGIAAVAILATGIGIITLKSRTPVAEQVLSSHLRSLMPGHLTDVQSTDQHNVKPWFNGRVDLAPNVPNIDSAGYPLLGGRVDYIGGKTAAVVVYGRRKHVINVFEWAEAGQDLAPVTETRNGFHLIHLREGGIAQWIVSDLNAQELAAFEALYTAKQ